MNRISFLYNKIPTLIILLFSLSFFGQTKIISTGDNWFYYDATNTPPENWKKPNVIENWQHGPSPLGYGDSAVVTTINFGENPEEKHISKFFKKVFTVDDPYQFLVYSINVVRDDGIVVYLNDREIMRNNMPDGEITDNTEANSLIVSSEAEKFIHKKLLLADDFLVGKNTLSVRVHKARKTSIDCIFDLELIGDNSKEAIPLLIKERNLKNLILEGKLKDDTYNQKLINKELKNSILSQKKDIIQGFLYAALILIIIFLVTNIYFYKKFSTKNKKLLKEATNLKEQISNKDRAMISSSIISLNHQQFLDDLKKEIEASAKKDGASLQADLKKIISKIDFNTGTNDDWESLKKHFKAVHSGFYEKIIKRHPSLSEIELRHCIFIKLHMQTKEIANILHISPKSVQASRYRIKKKMELSEEIDLKSYLLSI